VLRELFQNNRQEDTNQESDKKFKALLRQAEELEALEAQLCKELEVSPEQVSIYLSDPDNFTKEDWALIQEQMGEYEEKIGHLRKQKRDCVRLRKSYSERSQVQRHWLFIR
jgi:hypothetical protein